MSRPYAPAAYNALKSAMRAVTDDVGGLDASVGFTRVQRSVLGDYIARDTAKFPPADVILDLETIGDRPHVTAALARAQGYRLVRVEARAADDLAVELARVARDTAALFANAVHALGGRAITPAERTAMIRDLDDLARAAAEAISILNGAAHERS